MLDLIARWNGWLNGYVWGWPTIVLLLGTGLVLTIATRGAQFRYLGLTFREVLGKISQKAVAPGSVSPFQAVATALASTVGVGNIAGVATAIAIGGQGRSSGSGSRRSWHVHEVAEMWWRAVRERDARGVWRGGAMYPLRGLGLRGWDLRSCHGAMAAFGLGKVQATGADSCGQARGVAKNTASCWRPSRPTHHRRDPPHREVTEIMGRDGKSSNCLAARHLIGTRLRYDAS